MRFVKNYLVDKCRRPGATNSNNAFSFNMHIPPSFALPFLNHYTVLKLKTQLYLGKNS